MDRFSGSLILTEKSDGSSGLQWKVVKFLERGVALRLVQFTKVKTYEKSVILPDEYLCNCRNS